MRKNSPARYSLPDVLQPSDSKCYQVPVPNDPKHIAAFQGQIKALASAYSWADDPDHNALLAAGAWLPVFDDICLSPDPCGTSVPGILCISGSFQDDSYSFVPALGSPCSANYVAGVGYESCVDSGADVSTLEIFRQFPSSSFIRSASVHTQMNIGHPYAVAVSFFLSGSLVAQLSDTYLAGGGNTTSGSVGVQADSYSIAAIGTSAGDHDTILCDEWGMCYTGDFPMAQPGGWTIDIPFGVDDGGFAPVVAGGTTYAHYTGSEWYSGCEGCGGATYAQLQIYRVFTATNPFSITLATAYYTCAAGVTLQTATSGIGHGGSGSGVQVAIIPENPLSDPSYGSGALRLILTNDPQTSIDRIHLTRVVLIGTGEKPS